MVLNVETRNRFSPLVRECTDDEPSSIPREQSKQPKTKSKATRSQKKATKSNSQDDPLKIKSKALRSRKRATKPEPPVGKDGKKTTIKAKIIGASMVRGQGELVSDKKEVYLRVVSLSRDSRQRIFKKVYQEQSLKVMMW